MARGGIYDQVGGGFARYAVDDHWKVPHFEKMLYDNAQLISFYSELYKQSGNKDYLNIVNESIAFVDRELSDESGAFYSALDADSEGEEGKFYVWKDDEFKKACGHYAPLMADYFRVGKEALWEHGNNILLIKESKDEFSQRNNLSNTELNGLLKLIKGKLLAERSKRVRPGLDDKSLCSWNSMMMRGYIDAYTATANDSYLERAILNAKFIQREMQIDGELYHSWKQGKASIPAFMEDYAFLIDVLLALYSATMDTKWLEWSQELTEKAIQKFYSKQNATFYFSSKQHEGLVARKAENMDNVIPASNSTMANNLFILGTINHNEAYLNIAKQMLLNMKTNMLKYGSAFTNWSRLMLHLSGDYKVSVIIGKDAEQHLINELSKYNPDTYVMGSVKEDKHTYFQNRNIEGKTLKYVCKEGLCEQPEEI
jgi:uncharacterized protein YyaL (SSP411 family)